MSVTPILPGAGLIPGITSGTGTSATASTGSVDLGRDQFLNLLITQLRNQDPMSPLQPYEFAAQLAQFSSVEQLSQLNDAMTSESSQLQTMEVLSRSNLSAGLLGKHVLAEGDQVKIDGVNPTSVTLDVPGTGGQATLTLTDSSGKQVATRELGAIAPGRQKIVLPADLPAGTYHYAVSVKGADGKSASATCYVAGVVNGVKFQNGGIMLDVDGLEIPMDTLAEIAS